MSLEIARDYDEQASYQLALRFLTTNEVGERLDVHLSYESFQYLDEEAHALYGDAKYPRVEYSGTDSRVTIYTIPTALHGTSASSLQTAIRDSVRDILIRHDKRELLRCLQPVGEATYEFADDQGRPSSKTADGGLKYCKFGRTELIIVIEVGVSEAYQHLRADIELWLTSFQSPIGILLWLNERPRFSFPAAESCGAYSNNQRAMFKNAMDRTAREVPFGPYVYSGHKWFGILDTAIIEVFQRDMHTNKITSRKYPVTEGGHKVVHGDSIDIGLTIKDLFPPDEMTIDDIRLEPIRLDAIFLMEVFSGASKDTAVARFNHFVNPK
ncbi:hypothetical protein V1527DRAFT_516011 [Lipomyces starkeyi]